MDVLVVHNSYQSPGGEDEVVTAEQGLLSNMGHRVFLYRRSNIELRGTGQLWKLPLALRTVWAADSADEIGRLVQKHRPSVVHFHNTFPLISPAGYHVAKDAAVAVVQTLHNYRILCCNALLYRRGGACEDCVGKRFGWPGVLHRCYRGSVLASGVAAGTVAFHWWKDTWDRKVDVYIAPTRFAASRFIQAGFPNVKFAIKPHFVYPDPGAGEHAGRYVLFAGRLAEEKGVRTLITAWRSLGGRIPLKIVGDGPLRESVDRATAEMPGVEWLYRLPRSEVIALMQNAAWLIVPSTFYETFCLVVSEGFAAGTAAIVSGHGALEELVDSGRTGLHFRPGDPDDLAAKVEWAWTHPREMAGMGREARREFEQKYTAERNYRMLMEIYDLAISRARH